ncbi:hypothetical protein B0H21DRAFT_158239 [Amylocystis lapponica]|nr:hypothetical protein B0H21DRAFT_158239 [Amylocystis lapponica]
MLLVSTYVHSSLSNAAATPLTQKSTIPARSHGLSVSILFFHSSLTSPSSTPARTLNPPPSLNYSIAATLSSVSSTTPAPTISSFQPSETSSSTTQIPSSLTGDTEQQFIPAISDVTTSSLLTTAVVPSMSSNNTATSFSSTSYSTTFSPSLSGSSAASTKRNLGLVFGGLMLLAQLLLLILFFLCRRRKRNRSRVEKQETKLSDDSETSESIAANAVVHIRRVSLPLANAATYDVINGEDLVAPTSALSSPVYCSRLGPPRTTTRTSTSLSAEDERLAIPELDSACSRTSRRLPIPPLISHELETGPSAAASSTTTRRQHTDSGVRLHPDSEMPLSDMQVLSAAVLSEIPPSDIQVLSAAVFSEIPPEYSQE